MLPILLPPMLDAAPATLASTKGASADELIDVSVLLSEVTSELETQLSNADVRVAVEVADTSPAPVEIRADRVLVRLVARNLIENAIQHSPTGGEVSRRVRGSEQEQHVVVENLDQGPGHGSGLGLSIVQMALDRLGGSRHSREEAAGS
jgi:two-component system sensor histidine kinase QseC